MMIREQPPSGSGRCGVLLGESQALAGVCSYRYLSLLACHLEQVTGKLCLN